MNQPLRHFSAIDQCISQLDRALKTLTANTSVSSRKSPAQNMDEPELDATQKNHAASLMRVNHTGEVCAQALYQGQGLTAKLAEVREAMDEAANEEVDHLAWCEQRVNELNQTTSALNPLWYGLSFGVGATAGLISDKISLGFVAATEDQVCQHLQDHLNKLPPNDTKSRAIVEQMLLEEHKHGQTALNAGGAKFPKVVKWAMRQSSKVMTSISYRV